MVSEICLTLIVGAVLYCTPVKNNFNLIWCVGNLADFGAVLFFNLSFNLKNLGWPRLDFPKFCSCKGMVRRPLTPE